MPTVRFVTVDLDKLAATSPATSALRAALEAKQREATQALQPYEKAFNPLQKVPTTDAEKTAKQAFDRRAFGLRDSLQKAIDAFSLAQRRPMLDALAKGLATQAKSSSLDYVLERSVVPNQSEGLTANDLLSAGRDVTAERVYSCVLVRLDLEAVASRTDLGKKHQADLAKAKADFEAKKKSGSRTAESDWARFYKERTVRFALEISDLVKAQRKTAERVCILEHKAVAAGFAAAYEAKAGSLQKLPDATEWVAANLNAWALVEARGGAAVVKAEEARRVAVGQWVTRVSSGLAKVRGAVVALPPDGWTAAWKSTVPFDELKEVEVGTDSAGKGRARVVVGRGLSSDDAEERRDLIHAAITAWTRGTPWAGVRIPDRLLPSRLREADIWGKPADNNPSTDIWRSADGQTRRGAGTILLTIEPEGDTFNVFLEFAEASVPPPLKTPMK